MDPEQHVPLGKGLAEKIDCQRHQYASYQSGLLKEASLISNFSGARGFPCLCFLGGPAASLSFARQARPLARIGSPVDMPSERGDHR